MVREESGGGAEVIKTQVEVLNLSFLPLRDAGCDASNGGKKHLLEKT